MWTIRRTSALTGLLPAGDIVAWSRQLPAVLVTSSPTSYSSKSELEDADEKDKESGKKFKERLTDVKTAAKFVRDVANSETDSLSIKWTRRRRKQLQR
ncbi:hypothetical protein LINGRAHAP2_LOCUS28166 [Linum grandiflorum]